MTEMAGLRYLHDLWLLSGPVRTTTSTILPPSRLNGCVLPGILIPLLTRGCPRERPSASARAQHTWRPRTAQRAPTAQHLLGAGCVH